MVHRTEKVRAKRNPEWKPFDVMLKHLCAGVHTQGGIGQVKRETSRWEGWVQNRKRPEKREISIVEASHIYNPADWVRFPKC